MSSREKASGTGNRTSRPILVVADDFTVAHAVLQLLALPSAAALPLDQLAGTLARRGAVSVPVVVVVTERVATVASVREVVVRHAPEARVLAVSYYADDASVLRYLAAGADGIVPSPSCVEDLRLAVDNLIADRAHLPLEAAPLMRELIAGRELSPTPAGPPGAQELSARERDVLRHIAERRTNKEIASRLRVEEQTVKNHVSRILRKLGLRSRFDAARAARDLLGLNPSVRKADQES